MSHPYIYVQDDSALAEHLARWHSREWLAFDTEFLREDTYFPKLALIQVCDTGTPVCVDVQAVDMAPLVELLRNKNILKVFHSASQDLEILTRLAGECPAPLFDTQTAAGLLGEGEQLGYAALVEKRLGVHLDKQFTRLDWTRRPIPEGALLYAADDVRHLAELYPALRDELEVLGRRTWLEEDCAEMSQTSRYIPNPQTVWQRLKGVTRLEPQAQHRAARLAAWREATAIARDRPRRWILDDEMLITLAVRCPRDADELEKLGLSPKQLGRYTGDLLTLIARPITETAALKTENGWSTAQKNLIRSLTERVQAKARELEIAAPLLATRADIEALVRLPSNAVVGSGDTGSALMRGWRRAVIGGELLNLVTPSP